MASQNIVFPRELRSAEENPSKVSYLYPKPNSAKQSWIGFNLDIEERKLAEFYLAEAQRLAHMGSWAWQVAGGDTLHLSGEWYRIYGFDPKQGMPHWEEQLQRVHPEDRGRWQETIERAIQERSDYDVEFRILLPDGKVKWVHAVGHPVLSAAGELVQFMGISLDVTERKKAEEALRSSEAYLTRVPVGTGDRRLDGISVCRTNARARMGSVTTRKRRLLCFFAIYGLSLSAFALLVMLTRVLLRWTS